MLELGACELIDEPTPPDLALLPPSAPRWGPFAYAGQVCISVPG